VQAVLLPGESLEDFILAAVQKEVTARAKRHQFLQRAIASSQRAEETGHYVTAENVLARLEGVLHEAQSKQRKDDCV
jgi:hypothetical protein